MKVLIADNDTVTHRKLQGILEESGYDVITANDGNKAWKIIEKDDFPKMIILDWMMPGIDGVSLCKKIRGLPDREYIYIIMVTSKNLSENIVEGLEAGADDYIIKPFIPQELKVRVRAGQRILDLQDTLISAQEKLRIKATHDGLTGLFYRSEILEILLRVFKRSNREKTPLTVIMADLDYFKNINDTYGHIAGDAVLKETAQRLVKSLRDYDYIARYGGEEFLMIIQNCNSKKGKYLAERARNSIGSKPINTSAGLVNVTISVGVASIPEIKVKKIEDFINAADMALYKAKHAGRNNVKIIKEEDIISS